MDNWVANQYSTSTSHYRGKSLLWRKVSSSFISLLNFFYFLSLQMQVTCSWATDSKDETLTNITYQTTNVYKSTYHGKDYHGLNLSLYFFHKKDPVKQHIKVTSKLLKYSCYWLHVNRLLKVKIYLSRPPTPNLHTSPSFLMCYLDHLNFWWNKEWLYKLNTLLSMNRKVDCSFDLFCLIFIDIHVCS